MLENEGFALTGLEERGFWMVQELAQLKRDNRLLLDRIEHLGELVTDLKVQAATKLEKDDFFKCIDQMRNRKEDKSRAVVEVLKIAGASLGAAISALTGARLLR